MGCSHANAGRFCPSRLLGFPPAKPEKISSTIKALFKSRPTPDSKSDELEAPSAVALSPRLVCYGLHYLRNCTQAAFEHNNACFVDLAERAIAATERVLRDGRISHEEISRHDGNVWLYGSEAQARADGGSKVAAAAKRGWAPLQPLPCAECARRFPELSAWLEGGNALGGCLVSPTDWSADSRAFATAVRRAAERSGRVRCEWGARVVRLARADELEGDAVAGVVLEGGGGGSGSSSGHGAGSGSSGGGASNVEAAAPPRVLTADAVVLCTGLSTRALLAAASSRFAALPLVAMRGYSVDIHGVPAEATPQLSISDFSTELNLQATPLGGGRVRLVGFAEFVDDDAPLPELLAAKRRALVERARTMLPGLLGTGESGRGKGAARVGEVWVGLRPMTPDFLPLVGATRAARGVYVNAGHGGVGWTLAAATAELVAEDVVCGGGSAACVPLSPDRFLLWP